MHLDMRMRIDVAKEVLEISAVNVTEIYSYKVLSHFKDNIDRDCSIFLVMFFLDHYQIVSQFKVEV